MQLPTVPTFSNLHHSFDRSNYSNTYDPTVWNIFCERIKLYIEHESSKSEYSLSFYEWIEWSALGGDLSSVKYLCFINNTRITSGIWKQIFELEQTIHDKPKEEKIASSKKLATIWGKICAHYVELHMKKHTRLAERQYFSCWTYAANQGNPKANRIVGICYQLGIGVAFCSQNALFYITKASQLGDPLAMFYRGLWFEQKEQNVQAAIDYYKLAAAGNCTKARHRLGEMYFYGIEVERSVEKAVEYFSTKENEIYGPSLYWLGKIHRKSSPKEARRYFLLASARGFKKASFAHGKMLESEEDLIDAFRQYFNSAIRGYAKGQYKIACWYMEGKGINPNEREAKIWLKKAAAQNYHPAVQLLTKMTKENESEHL